MNGSNHGFDELHPTGHDRDGGTGGSGRPAACTWPDAITEEAQAVNWEAEIETLREWLAVQLEAASGNEGLDGLHPGKAR
jgi:hypothetical protein